MNFAERDGRFLPGHGLAPTMSCQWFNRGSEPPACTSRRSATTNGILETFCDAGHGIENSGALRPASAGIGSGGSLCLLQFPIVNDLRASLVRVPIDLSPQVDLVDPRQHSSRLSPAQAAAVADLRQILRGLWVEACGHVGSLILKTTFEDHYGPPP